MNKAAAPGSVYLVGAGPGDPDLITVKGMRLLSSADAIVYDRLVHPDLLRHAAPTARRIFVGKAPDRHTCSQEEIGRILVTFARRGLSVVRLKGGDPFVFGRGGEECLTLAREGIPFEVVPGISSAIAVPASAGIPVTHRKIASAFTVVTGHGCTGGDEPDWEALARVGTLVILMGLRRLPEIADRLIRAGLPQDTPVAVIASGTTRAQRAVVGPLSGIGAMSHDLQTPATIVIGEVVRLRPWIAWFAEGAAGQPGPFPPTFGGAPERGSAPRTDVVVRTGCEEDLDAVGRPTRTRPPRSFPVGDSYAELPIEPITAFR